MTDAPLAAHAPVAEGAPIAERKGFHLVDPSPWPIVGAFFALTTAVGLILSMKGAGFGPLVLAFGGAGVLFTMAGWWRDVILEAEGGYHNALVRYGLTLGMLLFIASEVMFFVAWFWAFFASSLGADDAQVYGRLRFHRRRMAAEGHGSDRSVESAAEKHVRADHVELCRHRSRTRICARATGRAFMNFLLLAIGLGVLFVWTQGYEYVHAPFAFKNSIYGATFFMATGFHGAHVIIGVIFLTVCLVRAYAGQLTPRQHLGFQFAAWYWHFVDVVWIFLFTCIYVWGSWGATIEGASR